MCPETCRQAVLQQPLQKRRELSAESAQPTWSSRHRLAACVARTVGDGSGATEPTEKGGVDTESRSDDVVESRRHRPFRTLLAWVASSRHSVAMLPSCRVLDNLVGKPTRTRNEDRSYIRSINFWIFVSFVYFSPETCPGVW